MQRNILQVVGSMDRAGVETWLMHILRGIDRSKFQFHFLAHTDQECAYDEEIRHLGGKIYNVPGVRNPVQYTREFRRIVRANGPFDAIHSHIYLYSGFVMRLAAQAGIPVRIAQSHTAPRKTCHLARLPYERLMRDWILRYATHRIAASRAAAEALFGKAAAKTAIVLYGYDFTRFFEQLDPREMKTRLGIPATRKVIGHVGRFLPVKNHAFIVELFDHVIRAGMDAHLLLVGEGPLFESVQKDIDRRKLSDRCTFAGIQPDIAPLLYAMDIFVFPSLYEGLGIVAAESQAAGVPVLISQTVPEEVEVIPRLVKRLALDSGATAWAASAIETLNRGDVRSGNEASLLGSSGFALSACIERLGQIYEGKRAKELAA